MATGIDRRYTARFQARRFQESWGADCFQAKTQRRKVFCDDDGHRPLLQKGLRKNGNEGSPKFKVTADGNESRVMERTLQKG